MTKAGCPKKVYVGDLGEAVKIGERKWKFPWKVTLKNGTVHDQSKTSGHLPSAVFEGKDDLLGVTDPQNQTEYFASGLIDWCGFERMLERKMWGEKETAETAQEWVEFTKELM